VAHIHTVTPLTSPWAGRASRIYEVSGDQKPRMLSDADQNIHVACESLGGGTLPAAFNILSQTNEMVFIYFSSICYSVYSWKNQVNTQL